MRLGALQRGPSGSWPIDNSVSDQINDDDDDDVVGAALTVDAGVDGKR